MDQSVNFSFENPCKFFVHVLNSFSKFDVYKGIATIITVVDSHSEKKLNKIWNFYFVKQSVKIK